MTDCKASNTPTPEIHKDMTVLDIVSKYRTTEAVFKKWDDKAGECICCNALFESIETVAAKYKLDFSALMNDLEKQVKK